MYFLSANNTEHIILIFCSSSQMRQDCYYLHFTDEKTEAQTVSLVFPQWHCLEELEAHLKQIFLLLTINCPLLDNF